MSAAGLDTSLRAGASPDFGEVQVARARGYWELIWIRFRRDKVAVASFGFLVLLFAAAFGGAPLAAHLLGHGPNAIFDYGVTQTTFTPVGPWSHPAPLWAERCRAEVDRIGLRRASSGQLTEGERRVAELAASGLTNREVAARLYVSPKTVEANLARAYRKLGIHSRAELGARLGAGWPSKRRETPDSSRPTPT